MKKILLITIIFALLIPVFAAEKKKLAVLNFDAKDDGSKYMIGKTGIYRDFKKVFGKSDEIELMDTDDTREFYEESGYSNLNAIGPEKVCEFTKALNADILVWGDIFSVSGSDYKILVSLLRTDNCEKSSLTIEIPKSRKKRQPIIKEEMTAKINDMFKNNTELLINTAKQYLNNNQFQRAYDEFNKVLVIEPDNMEVLLALGFVSNKLYKYTEAEEFYRTGLEIEPDNIELAKLLSNLYLSQERFEEAADALKAIAENDEENVELWLQIGDIYIRAMGLEMEAQETFERILEIDSENMEAKKQLGILLYKDGVYERAIEYLEAANQEWPDDEDLAEKLSTAYLKAGKLRDAIENYKSLIESTPGDVKNYLNLANAYRILATEENSKGNVSETSKLNNEAVKILKKILDIDSENMTAVLRISDAYIAISNYDDALKFANIAKGIDSENISVYNLLTKIYSLRATKKYNEYVKLQKQASEAIGEEANTLIEKRDSTLKEANRLFKLALKNVNTAMKYADNTSTKRALESQKKNLENSVKQSESEDFFD